MNDPPARQRLPSARSAGFGLDQADVQLKTLMAAAILLGGGGVGYGLNNLAIQLVAMLLLAINAGAVRDVFRDAPRLFGVLLIATLLLPLLHAVPLPPSVWQTLPGRDLVLNALALVGQEDRWFALTVDRNRTLVAFLGLLPPFAVLVLASRLRADQFESVFVLIVWLALLNFMLGGIQLATANAWGNIYPGGDGGTLYGTFANKNSTALFLVIGMVALMAVPIWSAGNGGWLLRVVLGAILALGVVLTKSRSGTLLAGLALSIWFLVFLSGWRNDIAARWRLAVAGAATLFSIFAIALTATNDRLQQAIARFSAFNLDRVEIWADATASVRRFWPIGSGMGTFDEVFQVDESLEYLVPPRAGRAHNDYLELGIEAGIAGIVLLAAWGGWVLLRAWHFRGWRAPPAASAALASLVVISLQSIVDYPLRNEALLCVFAYMAGTLAWVPAHTEK